MDRLAKILGTNIKAVVFILMIFIGVCFVAAAPRAWFMNLIVEAGPYVDPRAYHDANGNYFGEGKTGAQNRDALQAAFDNAAALGSGGIPVKIPGGAYYITGTVATRGVPYCGAGREKTKFFPTTAATVFKHEGGEAWGFSINYTGTLGADPGAVAIQLHNVSQTHLSDITVWNCYRAFQLLTTYGTYGNIWHVWFESITVSGPYDYAHYIDSTSDSTTLHYSDCHVYGRDFLYGHTVGNDNLSKGWYTNNVTTVVHTNDSMDGGDGSSNGSVISFTNGHQLLVDTFQLEGFKQTAGGTSSSPIFFSGGAFFQNFFNTSYVVDVGVGKDAYLFRGGYPSTFLLGSYRELAPTVTSGTRKIGNVASCQSVIILPINGGVGTSLTTLGESMFNLPGDIDDAGNRTRLMSELYLPRWAREWGGHLKADNTTKVLINLPARSGWYGPSANLTVAGTHGAGDGFVDQLLVVSLPAGPAQVKAVASANTSACATRTYAISGDNVTLLMGNAGPWNVVVRGTLLYPYYMP